MKKRNIHVILASLFFISALFYRPMLLGYYYATLGLTINCLVLIFYIASKDSIHINKSERSIFFTNITFSAAYSVLVMIYSNLAAGLAVIAINSTFIMTSQLAWSTSYATGTRYATKIFLRLIVSSGVISSILMGIDFQSIDHWKLFEVSIKDRGEFETAAIVFPFSSLLYPMTTIDYVFSRNTYLAIEPGVAPLVILAWRYMEGTTAKRLINLLFDSIFIFALISTISTTAPIFILIYFMLRRNTNSSPKQSLKLRKLIYSIIVISVSAYLILYLPYFGYFAKMETHGSSFEDRGSWYYGDEANMLRVFAIPLIAIYFIAVRKHLKDDFLMLFTGATTVAVLNVAAFTPLFFLLTYMTFKSSATHTSIAARTLKTSARIASRNHPETNINQQPKLAISSDNKANQ